MDYYRTYKGLIIEVKQNPELALDLVSTWGKTLGYIAKHSKNIIDLIEAGDYVNGNKVLEVGDVVITQTSNIEDENFHLFEEKDIETILTHEMYEQNCYKVGED